MYMYIYMDTYVYVCVCINPFKKRKMGLIVHTKPRPNQPSPATYF